MKKYDVIIIGSGLGGLTCGYILSKNGFNVCVVEQNAQLGGCLQTFKRGDYSFDTGFHYVGGLGKGQPLHTLFQYFDLLHLPWHPLDENGFDEMFFQGKSYLFANGYERFANQMSEYFPHQKAHLERYISLLKDVSNHIFDAFHTKKMEEWNGTSLFEQSAYHYLQKTIDDPLLQNILSGNSMTMDLNSKTLPLYTFAQINSSYIQSAWRLQGGSNQIVESLVCNIRKMGGTVLTNAKATQLIEKDGSITAVEINGEELFAADYVISDAHPAVTFDLIKEGPYIRKIFRKRIASLKNTFGMFTVHLALKENTVPYLNKNLYIYDTDDIWRITDRSNPHKTEGLFITFQVPKNGEYYTRNIDILTPMSWSEVQPWADKEMAHKSDDYLAFKEKKATQCIQMAAPYLPELKNGIDAYYTSSPLTYRDFTSTVEGSAFGIQKDYQRFLYTLLTPRTPLKNLFLTGQNLNLHGILGVSITSFFTCAEILDMPSLLKDIIE